jgi:hypothetical protein
MKKLEGVHNKNHTCSEFCLPGDLRYFLKAFSFACAAGSGQDLKPERHGSRLRVDDDNLGLWELCFSLLGGLNGARELVGN